MEKTHNISRYVLLCHIMLHTYCISFAWYIRFNLCIEFLTWHSTFRRPNIFIKTLIFVVLYFNYLRFFLNFQVSNNKCFKKCCEIKIRRFQKKLIYIILWLKKFAHFLDHMTPLPPALRRHRLWMAPCAKSIPRIVSVSGSK